MAIWSIDGKTPQADVREQRIHAGTIGGEHAVNKSFTSNAVNAVIDDADPRILYAVYNAATADFTATRISTFDYDGSTHWFRSLGAAAQMRFTGTSIAVMARTNVNSGSMQVFIDGVATVGRILQWDNLDQTTYTVTNPNLSISATSIVLQSVTFLGGATSGELMIGSERITFTGVTGTTLTGCTRGANGSTASTHVWTEMVYAMSWVASCFSDPSDGPNLSTGRIVYYNPFLSPGEHTILIVAINNPVAMQQGFWFDGFVTGTLLGARHIARQVGTVMFRATTNASGFVEFGALTTRTGVSTMGLLGYNQISSGGGTYPNLVCIGNGGSSVTNTDGSVSWDSGSSPSYALQGSASTTYTVQAFFTYIGESI